MTLAGKPLEVGVVCGEAWGDPPPGPPPYAPCGAGPRWVETDDKPVRREMRSARSASRLLVVAFWGWPSRRWRWPESDCPRWPSFVAVVDRAEREVVVLVGVPLRVREGMISIAAGSRIDTGDVCDVIYLQANSSSRRPGEGLGGAEVGGRTYGISDGVPGLDCG